MKIVYREDIEIVRGFGGIMGMKRFPVVEWLHVKKGDYEGHIPSSWRVPNWELDRLERTPISRAGALQIRKAQERTGSLRTQALRRKTDAVATKLDLFPGSDIARQVVEGFLTEEQGFEQARRINARHQHTRYDELLAKGYSKDEARERAEEVETK
jgi:hypothetical protein